MLQQFAVRSGFCHTAVFQHVDAVGAGHGRQAMRDHDDGLRARQLMDDLDDGSLALRIDVRRGLVEHVRRRISEQGASQRESLPLTTRKVSAFLRYRCIEPARLLHEPLCAAATKRLPQLLVARLGVG